MSFNANNFKVFRIDDMKPTSIRVPDRNGTPTRTRLGYSGVASSSTSSTPAPPPVNMDAVARDLKSGYEMLTTTDNNNLNSYLPSERKKVDAVLFDVNKLKDNLYFEAKTSAVENTIIEESFDKFVETTATKFSFSLSSVILKLASKFAVSSDFNFVKDSGQVTTAASYYGRYYYIAREGTVTIDKDMAKECLSASAKDELSKIDSVDRAKYFLKTYGVAWFSKTTFGGMFSMTSKVNRSHQLEAGDLVAAMNASIPNAVDDLINREDKDTEFLTYTTVTKFNKTSKVFMQIKAFGGDPEKLRNFDEWRNSVSTNMSPVSYDIEPIYSLVSQFDDSEIYGYLKGAYDQIIAGHEEYSDPEDGDFNEESYNLIVDIDWGYFFPAYWWIKRAKVKLEYLGGSPSTIIEEVQMERGEYETWRNHIRAPGSGFGDDDDIRRIITRQPLKGIQQIPGGLIN